MKYSVGFRNSVLRKVLPPENRPVAQVAREAGLSPVTINSWLSRLKDGKLSLDQEDGEPTPSQRPAVEKLKLLLQSRTVGADQKGEWLRQNGLHTEHLPLWEQELEGLVTDKQQELKKEVTELKKKIKQLEKEKQRDQKAMAEALALLTLKKKFEDLYGVEEED